MASERPTGILALPNELLFKILDFLRDPSTCRNLRLVHCRFTNLSISYIYPSISLRNGIKKSRAQMHFITSSGLAPLVKKLKIPVTSILPTNTPDMLAYHPRALAQNYRRRRIQEERLENPRWEKLEPKSFRIYEKDSYQYFIDNQKDEWQEWIEKLKDFLGHTFVEEIILVDNLCEFQEYNREDVKFSVGVHMSTIASSMFWEHFYTMIRPIVFSHKGLRAFGLSFGWRVKNDHQEAWADIRNFVFMRNCKTLEKLIFNMHYLHDRRNSNPVYPVFERIKEYTGYYSTCPSITKLELCSYSGRLGKIIHKNLRDIKLSRVTINYCQLIYMIRSKLLLLERFHFTDITFRTERYCTSNYHFEDYTNNGRIHTFSDLWGALEGLAYLQSFYIGLKSGSKILSGLNRWKIVPQMDQDLEMLNQLISKINNRRAAKSLQDGAVEGNEMMTYREAERLINDVIIICNVAI